MAQVGRVEPRPLGVVGLAPSPVARELSLLGLLRRNLEAEQDRWFLWLPVMFGGGIALYFLLPFEPWTVAATLPAAAALAVHLVLGRNGLAALATAALLAVALGLAAGMLRTEAMRAPVLERQTGPVDVYGFVELVEPRPSKGQRLTIRVAALEKHETHATPYRVRVRTMSEAQALEPGDAVRLKSTLSPPPGPALRETTISRAPPGSRRLAPSATPPRRPRSWQTCPSHRYRCRSSPQLRACARPSAGASSKRYRDRRAPSPTP
jgi:hypothetical protein